MYEKLQKELHFKTSRSGGKGGQHVNKTSSKVELLFDVQDSETLNEEQKTLILQKLKTRIDKDGILHIIVQKERSQYLNKKAALEKFQELLEKSLIPPKKRKKTKISKASKEKRLKLKKQKSEIKKLRGKL